MLLRRFVFTAFVVGFASLGSSPAWAWGGRGHRIATRIAEARLTPAARSAIRALLLEGDTLVSVSDWADHEGHDAVPGSGAWHFVNVPLNASRYDPRYCPGGSCVVEKIKHYRKVLRDRDAPKKERARALLFLVHFIEDVHQPLHVGDNHDRGGNQTQVQYFSDPTATNLHRVWDSRILEDASRDERKWVGMIEPLLTPENLAAWGKGTVEDWTNESLRDAKRAYFFPAGSTRAITTGTRLGRDYSEMALPIIRQRLAQAGVRLANELNAVFADEPAVNENVPNRARRKSAPAPSPTRR